MPGRDDLLTALAAPHALGPLDARRWDNLLRRARAAKLEARLPTGDATPPHIKERIALAARAAEDGAARMAWEIGRIGRALRDIPHAYLKGAAYAVAGRAPARGRIAGDVDILVPRAQLAAAQAALERYGWRLEPLDPYDENYYRRWSHELPPMRHIDRNTIVDVHHTILPPTSRRKPDPALLWRDMAATGGGHRVLGPADMVLHSAAHLFHDGEISGALRDLVDIRDLLAEFGAAPGFWETLPRRAHALDLGRPLYYALRYAGRLLDAAIPEPVLEAAARFAPCQPVRAMMDALAPRSLVPRPAGRDLGRDWPRQLLYMRAHWLRMPPHLLAAHLSRKAWMRFNITQDAARKEKTT